MMKLAFGGARLLAMLALLPLAIDWRSPLLASVRPSALIVLIAVPILVAAFEIWRARTVSSEPRHIRVLRLATVTACALVMLATLGLEARFYWTRGQILAGDAEQLERVGRHVIVGFRDPEELRALVERRAIAGAFLAPRNVAGKTIAQIRQEVDALQDLRRRQGLPPLWIAADQEGGLVSRLSPPLSALPALAEIVASNPDPLARQAAVRYYAETQGRELAALGVNLNFAPVVDLNFHIRTSDDRYTRIEQRAIASDPAIVRDVAAQYCATLREAGVLCTLKHFPGLGRVAGDTHKAGADLAASRAELEASDWVPFRALLDSGTVMMLGHARLAAVDHTRPASFSRPVIDIIRREWNCDGVLITDDFSMGAVYHSPEGIAGGSVAALQAGVDLILISYDTDQYFAIMQSLLTAAARGALRRQNLDDSDRRLNGLRSRLP
jgi:beta-N-acetylhexosaminidase